MAELKKSEKIIEIVNVSKIFDETAAVEDVNLYVRKGEFITFLGPSGCGKTTTLRMIAGFDIPTSGKILLNGKDITNLPPNKRPVNTVFQRYALFPHFNIYDNIAFGLKLKKIPVTYVNDKGETYTKLQKLTRKEIDEKVKNALAKQKDHNIFSEITFQFSWKTFPQWILHSAPPYQSRSSAATLDSLR